jgi:hypothetical protein
MRRSAKVSTLTIVPPLLLLLGAALPALPARASDSPPPTTRPAAATTDGPADLPRRFADLDSANPAVREEARTALMQMGRRRLESFQRLVAESRPLRPSQRAALREIVTHVYLSGEPYDAKEKVGFLGINMDTFGPRVIVTGREPGFPAYPVLQNGDVIVRIAERPDVSCTDSAVFGAAVQELGAGRRVHFDVLRGGRIVRVAVVLAARPVEADAPNVLKRLTADRRTQADDYWEQAFAPLFRERVG